MNVRTGSGHVSRRATANQRAEVFQSYRSRLSQLAYRMLGSRADADDLVQETYLRWHQSAAGYTRPAFPYLVKVATHLCLDQIRERKRERDRRVESSISESIVEDPYPSAETRLELAGEVSIALVAMLERLGPEERVAFLLHDVFDYDYPEMARALGKAEPACRQLIHRARSRLHDSRTRFAATGTSRARLLASFPAAIGTDDRNAIVALLEESAECSGAGQDSAFSSKGRD